ncbi:hypothetical protein TanjilG_09639 [Lupinus angustifolius]|uniref:Pentatricopeptide repeat-containing protein n=1 Tax=Lupinus angustifolius TaxID=3871 RepID=A0A4P1R3L4_LUPAN|nr:hypothetical protein TanjilG_09639 [Lupinus angustifolius]
MMEPGFFRGYLNPDAISWTVITSTYTQHGPVEDAHQLSNNGTIRKVNAVTLLSPIRFYPCRNSRVGLLDEAVEFMDKMPIEPNEMVWQTLLGACRSHGNVKLVKAAAQNILSNRA